MNDINKRIAKGKAHSITDSISLPLYSSSRDEIIAQFERMDNTANSNEEAVEMRREALNSIINSTNVRGRWANVYAAIEFVKENEWFWREKGYESFDAYWTENGGKSFGEWGELEAVTGFAKLVNPTLFNMDYDDAKRIYKQLDGLAHLEIPKRGRPVGSTIESIQTRKRVLESKDDAMSRIGQVAAYKFDSTGTNSIERRFLKLKKNRPDIAVKFLRGDYATQNAYGKWDVGMASAEKEAFGEVLGQSKQMKKANSATKDNLIKWVNKVVAAEGLDAVIEALNSIDGLTVTKS
jgi:hypothetical protein